MKPTKGMVARIKISRDFRDWAMETAFGCGDFYAERLLSHGKNWILAATVGEATKLRDYFGWVARMRGDDIASWNRRVAARRISTKLHDCARRAMPRRTA